MNLDRENYHNYRVTLALFISIQFYGFPGMSYNIISESFRLAELTGVPGRSEFRGTPRHSYSGTV